MLEVAGLDAFYGEAHILRGVSLTVAEGEVVALLGRNGAGKTTTVKSIMGLVRRRRGLIRYRGTDISRLAPFQICRLGIGYVPEERRIFKRLTVTENLEVGRRTSSRAGDGGRDSGGGHGDGDDDGGGGGGNRDGDDGGGGGWTFERLFELFPNLAERRGLLGGQLSGGEQQMLTIARTLMGNPRLVLLDEPSEGIAPIIVEQMARTIAELKSRGLTVVHSELNLHFARLVSDRATIIERGEIRYEGTIAALEAEPGVRQRYLAV
jgi:branched-chain amino acid transport system ATP-binding protein